MPASVVHKYTLPGHRISVGLPEGSTPLSVGVQRRPLNPDRPETTVEEIVVWYLCPMGGETQLHTFEAANTGDVLHYDVRPSNFIGTATTSNGIVWHVFDVTGCAVAP